MLEKFLKGTYSFERQLGKNIVFSKDEIAIIHKRKEKLQLNRRRESLDIVD